eukprot:TRINITY_DN67395_c9_g3_i2.p1 TRINITY_DN67395_c9_g3~~TRINITY_DN67395_c9_g3_i2.p1  ORF type:complete len:516 (+),score=44.07 TRINITY_DN67395_c9_g3_i2:166-1548(+)
MATEPEQLPPWLTVGLTPKKLHEVTRFSTMVHQHCKQQNLKVILNIGEGRGYLSRIVNKWFGHDVVGVDCVKHNKVYHQQPKRRKTKPGPLLMMGVDEGAADSGSPPPVEFHQHFVGPTTTVADLSPTRSITDGLLLGLHTCGDLGSNLCRIFVQSSQIHSLMFASCCWHSLSTQPPPSPPPPLVEPQTNSDDHQEHNLIHQPDRNNNNNNNTPPRHNSNTTTITTEASISSTATTTTVTTTDNSSSHTNGNTSSSPNNNKRKQGPDDAHADDDQNQNGEHTTPLFGFPMSSVVKQSPLRFPNCALQLATQPVQRFQESQDAAGQENCLRLHCYRGLFNQCLHEMHKQNAREAGDAYDANGDDEGEQEYCHHAPKPNINLPPAFLRASAKRINSGVLYTTDTQVMCPTAVRLRMAGYSAHDIPVLLVVHVFFPLWCRAAEVVWPSTLLGVLMLCVGGCLR